MTAILTAARSLPFADTWGMHDVGAGWGIVMMLFWVAVFAGVIWLVRGGAPRGETKETPGEILERRLADGTLTPEEYEERRRLLSGDSPVRPGEGPGEPTVPGVRS